MPKFKLEIIETVGHTVEIDAKDKFEAKEKFNRMVNDGSFNWYDGDFVGYEVYEIEEIK